ncbi:MAG TPA: endonuclease V [bacterium]|nr:endonuclease V [Candidatus Omnitrophota bacterium]HOJ60589.1 endonuclease V [bacterium]HOL94746.1 endonuclease V [bacterium]HPO99392.1 endonuclease V [bacterium]HXK93866.1 endonuclease V [bacterium]
MVYDLAALRSQQEAIAQRVDLRNALPPLNRLRTVAAADVSCNRFSKTGYAAVVVLSFPEGELLESASVKQELEFPYIPGYLAFREWPLVESCFQNMTLTPDVLICDGQGICHPRRAGLASYIGVMTGLVTIGCAKSRLVGEYVEPDEKRGSVSDLLLDGEKVGEVLRTRDGVKPLFISPGHRVDFHHATQLILTLAVRYRQPEPIRAVHQLVNRLRKGM